MTEKLPKPLIFIFIFVAIILLAVLAIFLQTNKSSNNSNKVEVIQNIHGHKLTPTPLLYTELTDLGFWNGKSAFLGNGSSYDKVQVKKLYISANPMTAAGYKNSYFFQKDTKGTPLMSCNFKVDPDGKVTINIYLGQFVLSQEDAGRWATNCFWNEFYHVAGSGYKGKDLNPADQKTFPIEEIKKGPAFTLEK